MAGRTARRRVLRVRAGTGPADGGPGESRADLLAVEDPLEIRVHGEPLTVTMRTPGDDIDLAAGFLTAEGIVSGSADLTEIRLCDANTADVTLATEAATAQVSRLRRNFLTTSACGICGKDSIDAITVRSQYDIAADPVRIDPAVLTGLPATLSEAQRVFASTGGLHAAGLFQSDGTLLALREDVGRQHRDACHQGFLGQLEGGSAAHQQDAAGEGEAAGAEGPADDLVYRVVAAYVFAQR